MTPPYERDIPTNSNLPVSDTKNREDNICFSWEFGFMM